MKENIGKRKLLLSFIIGLGTVVLIFIRFLTSQKPELDRFLQPISKQTTTPYPENSIEYKTLENIVNQAFEDTKGKYSVVIKNLKTGENYSLNEHKKYDAASLYKLWVMATAFRLIQDGILKEDEILKQDIAKLNDTFNISSESAEQTEGIIQLSISDAIEQMIIISDNYAALLLSEKVRLSRVETFLQTYGFSESKVGLDGTDPATTASDIALFFEKLYTGKLANTLYSEEMIRFLKGQKLNHKLPKYLHPGTVVAHKTGELNQFSHDAGIVYTPQGDYIITVLSETDVPSQAEKNIATLSRDVYTYFMQKGAK